MLQTTQDSSGYLQDVTGQSKSHDHFQGIAEFFFPSRGDVVANEKAPLMPSLELASGLVATRPSDLVDAVLQATDKQVTAIAIADPEGRDEFTISSDALNYWRLAWRCAVEWSDLALLGGILDEVEAGICAAREYEPDDFESTLQAVKGRARVPFGWSALDLAWHLCQKEPIRLLAPGLAGKRVPTSIAGIAYHLQIHQEADPILLPIDQIRGLLQQRKIVVSGAVQRLIEAGVLVYADQSYHTGKAREFRFVGVEGEHFVKEAVNK